jgi:hypothetical protein
MLLSISEDMYVMRLYRVFTFTQSCQFICACMCVFEGMSVSTLQLLGIPSGTIYGLQPEFFHCSLAIWHDPHGL